MKHNQHDAGYYATAEIVRNSKKKGEKRVYFIEGSDIERITYLCKTDNVLIKSRTPFPYNNNFEHTYYPWIVDIDTNNSITPQGKQKLIGSFSLRKGSPKRINLIVSPPKISLTRNIVLSSQDNEKNILQNGSIEEIDSPEESYKKLVKQVSNYDLYYEYKESVRTPKKAHFKVTAGTEKKPTLGIESESPINGSHSALIKFNNGSAYLFFEQHFHNGHYHYSFLIQGKKGTLIRPVYTVRFNWGWKLTPICLFTVPDNQTYYISTEINVDEMNETEFFMIGVEIQNGEALLDDFLLTRQ